MSTRSMTIVRQRTHSSVSDYEIDELFRFYRHCDGYPEGHGLQMAMAFEEAESEGTDDKGRWISEGLNNRNWAQKCFAKLFAKDCDLEVEPIDSWHGDLDYLYVVEGKYDFYGGKHNIDELPVTISIYVVAWGDRDSEVLAREPVFSGTPAELIKRYA